MPEIIEDAEVNREIEVDNPDEIVTEPVDDKEVKEAMAKAQGTGSEDTTNSQVSVSSPDKVEPLQEAVKPVEGETPRERALRAEVTRLKEERRNASKQQIANAASRQSYAPQVDERLKALKAKYSDEEIRNMEEAIDVLAANRGYVKKEQNYQDMTNQVLENFIEAHPEYKPSNDKDDVRWERFQEILFGDYNLTGKSSKELQSIFSKVNRDVESELGPSEVKSNVNRAAAQQQKLRSVSHSGGTKTASNTKLDIEPGVRKMFKDFSDEDLMY